MDDTEDVVGTPERVFFIKSRPQGADIIDIVLSEMRVFVGYPPWKRNAAYDPTNIQGCVVDLSTADDDWRSDVDPESLHRSMQTVRNFAKNVRAGWIVLIPRPGEGKCWLAEVGGKFELSNDPLWRSRYLNLREHQGLERADEASHVGDIIQGWPLSRIVDISFALLPRWISYRLLSRPQMGEIYGFPELNLFAHRTLKRLIDRADETPLEETRDLKEIERRLITFLSPSSFEHLCVALLQLEYPDELWFHVGGSGDGGADGLGYAANWAVTGLLQCKWYLSSARLSDEFDSAAAWIGRRRVLASLIHGEVVHDVAGAEFWGRERVANLLYKHARSVPLATTLRIASS